MNTQRRPGLHAGMTPRLARQRTSSGCIFRNAAASRSVSVFIDVVDLGQQARAARWIVGLSSDCSTSSGLKTTLDLIATTIRDDFFQRFVGSFDGTYALWPSSAHCSCARRPRKPARSTDSAHFRVVGRDRAGRVGSAAIGLRTAQRQFCVEWRPAARRSAIAAPDPEETYVFIISLPQTCRSGAIADF